ncbi:hypothetical protein FL583_16885 [Cryptosporangium phraense]|uniref:Uncharacterized protein n=1 Tax=Cryptosporangium phraense TaxID=2593070 RepID=A0A545AQW6_9ACTN|nr:hypothetical protein FL583_16885 [Cryptosporangium phraense]
MNAVVGKLRTSAPRREIPRQIPIWKTAHERPRRTRSWRSARSNGFSTSTGLSHGGLSKIPLPVGDEICVARRGPG